MAFKDPAQERQYKRAWFAERMTEQEREAARAQERERSRQRYYSQTPEQRERQREQARARYQAKRAQAGRPEKRVVRLIDCRTCELLNDCRYVVMVLKTESKNPFCFEDSPYYPQYVKLYGYETEPQPEPAAAQGELWVHSKENINAEFIENV